MFCSCCNFMFKSSICLFYLLVEARYLFFCLLRSLDDCTNCLTYTFILCLPDQDRECLLNYWCNCITAHQGLCSKCNNARYWPQDGCKAPPILLKQSHFVSSISSPLKCSFHSTQLSSTQSLYHPTKLLLTSTTFHHSEIIAFNTTCVTWTLET